jgi:hypothetical protein
LDASTAQGGPFSTKLTSSRSLVFTTPSMTLNRYRFGPLRSFRLALIHLEQMNKSIALYKLRFTFKERTVRRNRPRDFLSHEIHSLTPLHRHPLFESTPRTCKQAPSIDTSQAPSFVPSSQFLTVSMVYSSHKVAGLLRPATDPEVRLVFCVPLPHCKVRQRTVTVLKT